MPTPLNDLLAGVRAPAASPDDAYVTELLYAAMQARFDDPNHLANAGTLYMRRVIMGRLFARYEAFRLVQDLPGSIVELGVFKGESLLMFAKLVELLNANDRSCRIIGFDNFRGFEGLHAKDGGVDEKADRRPGGWNPSDYYPDLQLLLKAFDHDRAAGHKPRIELVEGNIVDTVPSYVERNQGLKIKLLHLDCDMYEPTMAGLRHLYDRVVRGGVILLDEYGLPEFPGETAAVDEFFAGRMPLIRKFPFYTTPGGYIIKE